MAPIALSPVWTESRRPRAAVDRAWDLTQEQGEEQTVRVDGYSCLLPTGTVKDSICAVVT